MKYQKKELDVVQLDVTYLILIIVVFTTKSKLLILKSLFMKNLNNYGVKELSSKQMNDTNGGLIGVLFLCALVILAPAAGWFSTPSRGALGQPYR